MRCHRAETVRNKSETKNFTDCPPSPSPVKQKKETAVKPTDKGGGKSAKCSWHSQNPWRILLNKGGITAECILPKTVFVSFSTAAGLNLSKHHFFKPLHLRIHVLYTSLKNRKRKQHLNLRHSSDPLIPIHFAVPSWNQNKLYLVSLRKTLKVHRPYWLQWNKFTNVKVLHLC